MNERRLRTTATLGCALVIGAAALALSGCSSPQAKGNPEIDAPGGSIALKGRYARDYVLGAGDEIEIVVLREAAASRTVTIRPDGKFALPLAGEQQAAGLTTAELDDALTLELSKRLVEPEVTVIAKSVREPSVYVVGEVNKPGPIPFALALTAAEAVARAGDLQDSAESKEISVIRLERDGKVRITPIVQVAEGQPAPYLALASFQLEPEDVVVVPESGIYQFARKVEQIVTRPLTGVNALLTPFFQLRIIREISDDKR